MLVFALETDETDGRTDTLNYDTYPGCFLQRLARVRRSDGRVGLSSAAGRVAVGRSVGRSLAKKDHGHSGVGTGAPSHRAILQKRPTTAESNAAVD